MNTKEELQEALNQLTKIIDCTIKTHEFSCFSEIEQSDYENYKKLIQELIDDKTPKPLAENRTDIMLDWNVEVDCSYEEFLDKFVEFVEFNGWCGGGICGPQKPLD